MFSIHINQSIKYLCQILLSCTIYIIISIVLKLISSYSNFVEERHIRYAVGNLTIRLCSGLFHRIDAIKQAADKYDYSPYNAPKSGI
jgi:hypothetical protein